MELASKIEQLSVISFEIAAEKARYAKLRAEFEDIKREYAKSQQLAEDAAIKHMQRSTNLWPYTDKTDEMQW